MNFFINVKLFSSLCETVSSPFYLIFPSEVVFNHVTLADPGRLTGCGGNAPLFDFFKKQKQTKKKKKEGSSYKPL